MYKELEKYLCGYFSMNYWYDEGVTIAQNMIEKFNNDNWNQLIDELSEKSLDWKKKLAYCLYDTGNTNELLVLLDLVETEDDELFEICLDSLRDFMNEESVTNIAKLPHIIERIKKIIPHSGKPTQIVFKDLLTKISNLTGDASILLDDDIPKLQTNKDLIELNKLINERKKIDDN